jgi:hypothetical protein
MPGGALRAFFKGAQEDVARAVESAAGKMAGFGDATAQGVRDSVSTVRSAESASAEAVSAIRPGEGAGSPGGGSRSRIWRALNPEDGGSAAAGSTGPPGAAPGRIADILNGGDAPAGGLQSWLTGRGAGSAIDSDLAKVNPRFDPSEPAYSGNCTSVVQAYELRRRGRDVQAGPLEEHLWPSGDSPGGRPARVVREAWGGEYTPGTKAEIEKAFEEPGSRGVAGIIQDGSGGQHLFNVENSGGRVRFVDAQSGVADASHYFDQGHGTAYLRLDNRPMPPEHALRPYVEH